VTPFDVVKTRMQSIDSGTIHSKVKITGTMVFVTHQNGMVHIARNERILNLWRGLTPALVGSLPSTVFYYTGYEALRDFLTAHTQSAYSPLFAGAIARSVVVGLISPLELFRTRMQADNIQISKIISDVSYMVKVYLFKFRTMELPPCGEVWPQQYYVTLPFPLFIGFR
jgi:solute carrier family 25, member 39/40